MKIKLVITDIDGVWTDGGMFYDQFDNEWKKFNVSDGWGVRFLRDVGIPLAIMTGEDTNIVQRRADKLKIEYLYLGAKHKLQLATKLCEKLSISLEEVAFIGDDLNDLKLLRAVGLSACPQQSPDYIKSEVSVVMTKRGGEGVFREFVEFIIKEELPKLIETY